MAAAEDLTAQLKWPDDYQSQPRVTRFNQGGGFESHTVALDVGELRADVQVALAR